MFKALKITSLGLGICCLTLSLSSVSRASQIYVDDCKYGKHDTKCHDVKDCDFGKLDIDLSKLLCDLKDLAVATPDLTRTFKVVTAQVTPTPTPLTCDGISGREVSGGSVGIGSPW